MKLTHRQTDLLADTQTDLQTLLADIKMVKKKNMRPIVHGIKKVDVKADNFSNVQ